MSITFEISCSSMQEFEALESEGAPRVNMSNSNALFFMEFVLGINPDYSGVIDPADFIDKAHAIHAKASRLDDSVMHGFRDNYWRDRAEAFLDVCVAARNLSRKVQFC